MKRVLKTVGKAAAGIGAAAAAAGLVLRSDLAAEGVKAGITLCLETVIPSLFAFMVLSDFLAAGGGRGGFSPRLNGWRGFTICRTRRRQRWRWGWWGGTRLGRGWRRG